MANNEFRLVSLKENEQNYEDLHFLSENRPSLHKYTGELTLRALTLVNYDPFSIYKGTNRVSHFAKYRLYMSKELKIEIGHQDIKLKQQINFFKSIYLTYLVIKYTTICIVQIVKCNIFEDYKSRNSLDAEYRNDQTFKFFDSLGDSIGNPLSALTGVSLMIYSAFIVSFVYSIGYLPYYFTFNPMDAVNLRFMLDPQREIKRIDILIKNKLNEYGAFINSQRFPLRENPINCYDDRRLVNYRLIQNYKKDLDVYYMNKSGDNILYLDKQMSILEKGESNIWKMRPDNYSSKRYYQLHINILIIQITSIIVGIIILLYLPREILFRASSGKCQAMYSRENCTFNQVFNWRDILSFAELLSGLILLGIILVFESSTIISNTFCQLKLAKTIKEDLADYLNHIRIFNRIRDNEKNLVMNENNSNFKEFIERLDERVMMKMLRYLIKLTLSEIDLQKNASYMTIINESFLTTISTVFLSSLLASRLNGLDMRSFRATVLSTAIIVSNIILYACARVYAKIIDTEKLGWSILAQNSIRTSFSDSIHSDVFSTGWRKLIISGGLSGSRNAVCLFGLAITFKRVLEFNFLVISLISLLR